jgi:curli biogenesis system outer membrane secretion channel CsgG
MRRIIAGLVVCCFAVIANAVPSRQPTMAVLPFQISPVITTINIGNLTITRTVVEREFSNQLINFLTKSRKFNMLSRAQIKKVMDENRLTESDWTKPDQAEKMGKLLVADYLVTGVINRLEFQVIRQNIKITGETAPRIVATFKCQFQIIETSSGKIMMADQVIKKLKSIDVRKEIPATERKDWTLSDFKDLLFSKTATEVGNAVLSGIYPVKIVEVKGNKVILNRGRGAGIKVGKKYLILTQGKAIIDVDTGESLGGSEEEVGMVEVTSVEVKFSKGKILSGAGKIQYGDICRPQKKNIKNAKPAYPKATQGW